MKLKIKKGDSVQVISGSQKGKKGTVTAVIVDSNRAVIEGVNIVKKHMKPTNNNPGGIIEMSAPLPISNLSLLDPKSGVPTRVGYKMDKGNKVRYSKKSGEIIK
ncbi:MAG: 50S ribosomal protein L24 [Saprospiraceae bacterium]|jgi:large subunit ribosomal protein L24|nr:50S ribosomal protein L24 [Candidatus Defluviibacterium haderslevense]MCC7026025.1 50S ribosomal protein L24 [Saprospiraceae bacterium]MBK7244756.1 50S ribosomal protein L24 [Candidatus Defluviibacterium haderslevense]MBK8244492.1 50S ribosomal protein L24 [Candidatus Defluviibacterium haderslevense]MBL0238174.1 50S ribosomal protein L24 [Candidatus Defluviibacterium haderslevense]